MTTTLILTALFIMFLLTLSAFFSGSETALTAASRARMHELERRGQKSATIVNGLLDNKERMIGAILLGNNLANICASALATSLFLSVFGDAGVAYATLVMTALVVVFAEVLPKTYAINNADRMSLGVAPILRVVVTIFGPITPTIEAIVKTVLGAVGATNPGDTVDEASAQEEIRGAIDLHSRRGAFVSDHRYMLGGVLDLGDLDVSDIMVHRTNMEALNADDAAEDIVASALSSSYSRLPLWRDSPDNIVGILHVKDMIRAVAANGGKAKGVDILALASPPWFVPDTTTLQDQLNAFLKRKKHFALVVDEYGEVMGLVTLEDILEEIVGDIEDEHDVAVKGVSPHPDGSVLVDGSVPIRDLNRAMEWQLPDEEATTIAGLVIHEAQLIPEPGQAFTFFGFRFEVTRRQRNRITALKIRPAPSALPSEIRQRMERNRN